MAVKNPPVLLPQISVVPAQPGWFILWPNKDFTDADAEPVIAWRVERGVDGNDQETSSTVPIVYSTEAPLYQGMMRPDGKVYDISKLHDSKEAFLKSMRENERKMAESFKNAKDPQLKTKLGVVRNIRKDEPN